MWMSVCVRVCVLVCVCMCIHVPVKAIRGCWIPWSRSCKWPWAHQHGAGHWTQVSCKSSKHFKTPSFSPVLERSFVHLDVRCVRSAQVLMNWGLGRKALFILSWLSCLSFPAVLLARLEAPGIQIDLAFGILKSERSSFLGEWVGRWSQANFLSIGSCCFALGHCRGG